MSDRMIGFVTVDLSILNAGFRAVNGWYNILDIHGNCQGQLKVAITPTSDFSELSRKIESSEFISGNRALHSVPLLGPVETPSGSMYYPGVKSSQQTVGSTCTMSDNMAGLTRLITAPSVPTPSLLKRNQKSCLLGTLQRQMHNAASNTIILAYLNNLDTIICFYRFSIFEPISLGVFFINLAKELSGIFEVNL